MTVILASTSPYRQELLSRLDFPFVTQSPAVDETPLLNECADNLVKRLSQAKAEAIAPLYPNDIIIGSDQVALLNTEILGKPGDFANAHAQLTRASGQCVRFLTGICVINTQTSHIQVELEVFIVHFKALTPTQINNYLQREQPFNCAGSFKSEGLGVALMQRMQGDDPSALIGLPLIRLVKMLANTGFDVLGD